MAEIIITKLVTKRSASFISFQRGHGIEQILKSLANTIHYIFFTAVTYEI